MAKKIYVFENLNPDGERIGDCVIRAIAKATNKPYVQIEDELYLNLGKVGYRNIGTAWKTYIDGCNFKKLSFPAKKGCSRITACAFAESHPNGRYILRLAGHLTACVDGKIYDIWDCSKKCVYNAWEVEAA